MTNPNAQDAPSCPCCQKPMVLVRTLPKFAGLAELRTYHCKACDQAVTIEGNE